MHNVVVGTNIIKPGGEPSQIRSPKVQEAYDQIKEMAHALGPEARLPSIRELKERLGLSLATLDAALGDLEAQRVIRRRQGSGIYVREQVGKKYVCLISEPRFFYQVGASPFWGLLLQNASRKAEDMGLRFGMHFMIPGTNPYADSDIADGSGFSEGLAAEIAAQRVDGVIALGLHESQTKWIKQFGVPMAAFAGAAPYMVKYRYEDVADLAMDSLVEQGCSRIGLMYFENVGLSAAVERAAHRPTAPIWMESVSQEREHGSLISLAFNAFLRRQASSPVDGLLCLDDMMAQGALMAMHRLGLRPGMDLKIATYANESSPILLGWEHEITRIGFDPKDLVEALYGSLALQWDPTTSIEHLWQESYYDAAKDEHSFYLHPHRIPPLDDNERSELE